jgi:hypothetical protein
MGSCIQLAQPIGFRATWLYLQWKVERSWRDPEFLLPALALLESERTTHLLIDAEYARMRREHKAAGFRFPRRDDVTPRTPCRWHGDERMGARFALEAFRTRGWRQGPKASHVLALVDRNLGQRAPTVDDLEELQEWLAWARHRPFSRDDLSQNRDAGDVFFLLCQLHLMIYGAVPLATQWNFTLRQD